MTMRFVPNLTIPSADGTLIYLFEWLDFMRTASPTGPGWTVPRSSDGTTGGDGDNIAAFGDLSQWTGSADSWFVIRQPDGGREYLFFRTSSTDTVWSISYSPGALYVGGSISAIPTATDSETILVADILTLTGNKVLHAGADDAAPYGWYVFSHLSGNFVTEHAGMAMIPITDGAQPGETDPVLFFQDGGGSGFVRAELSDATKSANQGYCAGFVPGSATFTAVPALSYNEGANYVFPGGNSQDDNNDDVAAPIPFSRRSGHTPSGFKGFSDFIQWNGVTRTNCDTFARGGSGNPDRISWGDVNFEWDSVTTPSVS